MKTMITRETMLGWGYNTFNGGRELPKYPNYTGKLSTIVNEKYRDMNLRTLNVDKSSSWFVLVEGEWKRIKDERWLQGLLDKCPWGGYVTDEEDVELDSDYEITDEVRVYMSHLGSIKSPAKTASSRANGKLGGRHKKVTNI